MKDATRIKIAALATALFVGLLTAGGLAVRPSHAPHATAAAPTQSAQPSFARADDDDDGAPAPNAASFSELDDE
jgi:hypothetical protein